jgi:PRC-barrel domain
MAIECSEQGNLIGSDKVEGSAVYGADNNKIGSTERVMIEKASGKVAYVVLSSAASSALATTITPAAAFAPVQHKS